MLDPRAIPRLTGQYGMHALRHFFASVHQPELGRRAGVVAKVVQERLGHATIHITLDMYGHLFPRGDDRAVLAAGEAAILGDLDAT